MHGSIIGQLDSHLHLKRVNLSLENRGSRHRLEFSAEFAADVASAPILDIGGDPLVSAE
jgi:hypothetical protein